MSVILAADIGGTSCKLGIFDEEINLIEKWEIPTDISEEGSHILPNVHDSFRSKEESLGFKVEESLGAGLGMPGPVDFEKGILNGCINLNIKGKSSISTIFHELSGTAAIVDNDANVAALGEQSKGAGHGHSEVVMITLGTGVGGGVISGGSLIHGTGGSGGEIGHIKVDFDGRFQCNCGKRGCLETVASATGMVNLAGYHAEDYEHSVLSAAIKEGTLTSKAIMDAAMKEDPLAEFVVEEAARYLAVAMSSISVITNPGYFIFGGGVSRAGEYLTDKVRKHYDTLIFPPAAEDMEIVMAELGNDAGMYGAARLVKQYLIKK
ncbi:MAG TPA: ROK family glucokinase [Candidatus Salinicoccus stercoripullorum]|uniref:Glucokinase n=1 Tax=Candidatus Salinicoccus stercoripullorum TaxID=2838756 RepID=A0A9D1QHD0_9STAP|nr:ROK family glucokinase [Candidatus Salinicoccus stercoripullorum]